MFQAIRAASRRASSSAGAKQHGTHVLSGSSAAAAVALMMAALSASDRMSGEATGVDDAGTAIRKDDDVNDGEASDRGADASGNGKNSRNVSSTVRSFADRFATTTAAAAASMMSSSSRTAACDQAVHGESSPRFRHLRLTRALTSRRLAAEAAKRSFFTLYEVDFDNPLGSGAYGDVYLCRVMATGDKCALKKIPKEFTEDVEFQREMNALMHIRAHGGHPNICMLRENFDEHDDYLLVLDLIEGKEMFDHLIQHGAYSEADASRLVRQVASALDYIHGIGVVHADLKPENIMIQSSRWSNAVIKLIDFGCSEVLSHPEPESGQQTTVRTLSHEDGATTAYCPPEAFDVESRALAPSADMWALGVILYTMLLGRHPFDLDADASQEEVGRRIKEQRQPPLHDCPYAGGLSPSALDLLGRLMEPDPDKRLTAHDMLHHPWVTGETARRDVIEDSAARLKTIQRYRSGIEKTVIESLISFSEDKHEGEHSDDSDGGNNDTPPPSAVQTSLLERAFDQMDKDQKGFLSTKDLKSLRKFPTPETAASALQRRTTVPGEEDNSNMSFNHFSDVVGEKMRSTHFPKGHVIYKEGDEGNYMYFINSGTIEVTTEEGFVIKKGQGDYFGKSGVLGRPRRTTITCTTPVNVLMIDKDHFKKHVVVGSPLGMKLREKINTEKFDRAVSILNKNAESKERHYRRGDVIFESGGTADKVFVVKEGRINVSCNDHHMLTGKPGHLLGAQAIVKKDKTRVATATCSSQRCVIHEISLGEFERVLSGREWLNNTIRELALRQEFRRAVVLRRRKSFSASQLREVFDEIDLDNSGCLDIVELRRLMEHLGTVVSDEEIQELVNTLDLNESGNVDFGEFQSIFGGTFS